MTDEFDIDALLESSYKKKNLELKSDRDDKRVSRRERHHRPSNSESDGSSDSRDRYRRDRRSRRRSRSPDRRRRSSSQDRDNRSSSRDRYRSSRSRDRDRSRRRRDSSDRYRDSRKKRDDNMVPRSELVELTTEERDARTVFLMQLQRSVTSDDIAEFFREAGRVRDIRMISDKNSRRPKGISYVEFENIESVNAALKMTGHFLKGGPVIINPTMSEKNRTAMESAVQSKKTGPTKVFVSSLNPNISEQMLRAMFEPFGTVTNVTLQYDEYGTSRGQGYILFREIDCAEEAVSKLNNIEIAGNLMKLWIHQDRNTAELLTSSGVGNALPNSDKLDTTDVHISSASRNEVMQKLATSRGLQTSSYGIDNAHTTSSIVISGGRTSNGKIIEPPTSGPSQCVVFSNMFDYKKDHRDKQLLKDVETDVYKKVSAISQVLHVHIDSDSSHGNVYTKFKSIEGATKVIEKLNGIKYSGRTIKAFNVTLHHYSQIFPDI